MALLGISTVFVQRLSSADQASTETAQLVTKMMPKYHLSRKGVDDAVSAKLLEAFLKDLDPQKLYFLSSHVAEFNKHRTTLDDELREGNVDFANQVFDVYRQRMAHVVERAHFWIDQDFDFTVDEFIETKPEKISWCETEEQLDDRWRKRIKYDILQARLDGAKKAEPAKPGDPAPIEEKTEGEEFDIAKTRERLHKRYRNNLLLTNQLTTVDQLETFLTAFTETFDPHSTYMSPHSWEDFEIQMKLSLDGIGAALKGEDGETIVASIVPGGAASTDGRIKVNDKITAVGQEQSEMVDIFEMKLSEVVRMIRGPRGTKVRLQVKPADGGESKVIELTRQKIELNDSAVKGEVIETKDRLGRPGRIGVISVPSFYRDFAGANGTGEFKSAAVDVKAVIESFRKAGNIDAVVVDLRNNGGGALTEAIEISGHFIDQGPVVQVKDPTGIKAYDDEETGVLYAGPLVVICNRLSASASEIFAGVVKDYRRGIVIGDTTTHGKGTVQNLMEVSPGGMFRQLVSGDRGKLKLTIQQFYRVNGESTQNHGVRSDIVLPSIFDHWDLGESFLENALPFDEIRPAKYAQLRYVNPEIIAALQQNSETRVQQKEDFQKIEKAIQRYIARKDRTTLSLNEQTVRQERAEDEAAEKEHKVESEEDLDKTPDPNAPIFPPGYYNDEVLNVTLDYVAALQGRLTVDNNKKTP